MNSVHDVVEETSKVINKLVTRTQQIDTALAAITNIAEQTNLLALNAAIGGTCWREWERICSGCRRSSRLG